MTEIKINFNQLSKYIGETRYVEKFGNTIERRDYKSTDAEAVRHFTRECLRNCVHDETHVIVEGKLPAWMWLHICDELRGIEHLTWTSVGSVADVEIY